mgnify:CR=1 FL=1
MVKKNNMKNNLLTNKIVLYLTAFISLFYIINEIVSFNFLPIVIFYLLTIIVYKYTKNMIIVLGIPFIILMLLKLLLKNNKEGFKEGKVHKKEKFSTKSSKIKKGYENLNSDKLSPKIIDSIPNVDKLKKNSKEENIERGLDDLENVLADKNINSISESTEKIIKQQKELMNSLKEITPALGDAMSAIGKIDMNSLTSMFQNINKNP